MGRSLEDVRAVLLTHAHDDHIGFAERIRSERGTPIHLHEADAALARGEAKQKNEGGGPMKPIPMLSFLRLRPAEGRPAHQADRRGLDVRRRRHAGRPGTPRVIHRPRPHGGECRAPRPVARRDPRRRRVRDAQRDERLDRPAVVPQLQRRQPPGAGIAATPRWGRGVAGAAGSWAAVDRRPGRSPDAGPGYPGLRVRPRPPGGDRGVVVGEEPIEGAAGVGEDLAGLVARGGRADPVHLDGRDVQLADRPPRSLPPSCRDQGRSAGTALAAA